MEDIITNPDSDFLSQEEQALIIDTIQQAEQNTSGEVRLFVESNCKNLPPVERALQIFQHLQMENTVYRNAVLIYIALNDHKLAIYGDEGIHEKVSNDFWEKEVKKIVDEFEDENYTAGIIKVVQDIGEVLKRYFPAEIENKNELPDDIVFGT